MWLILEKSFNIEWTFAMIVVAGVCVLDKSFIQFGENILTRNRDFQCANKIRAQFIQFHLYSIAFFLD